jgi:hypothetical protein
MGLSLHRYASTGRSLEEAAMKCKYLSWVIVPLVLGLVSYGAHSGALARTYAMWMGSAPVIEFSDVLELGEHELNEELFPTFAIRNRGGRELVVDQVGSNCACSGLVRQLGDRWEKVDSIHIQPGQEAELALRIGVRGLIGKSAQFGVQFRTNDPTRPEASIKAIVSKVRGGLITEPRQVTFPPLCAGAEAQQVIDLIDTAAQPRAVVRVVSSEPEQLRVRLLAAAASPTRSKPEDAGTVVARIELTVRASHPGTMRGEILVHLDDASRPPEVIPITLRVVSAVEITPSALILPRASNAGPLYYAECLCRGTQGKPLSLRLDTAPPGVSVVLSDALSDASIQRVRIEWKPPAAKLKEPNQSPQLVRLRARVGDVESILEIPLYLREGGKG